jgi:formamidopyrimidine-DNA glycosylase
MPELPEVELVAKSLEKLVSGRNILIAELLRQRLAPDSSPESFGEKINGSTINSVSRRGKHILFDLNNSNTLIVHLRMSGRFMLLPIERELPKFSHAIFYFEDESRLIFTDQRHFGFMKIVETENLQQAKEIAKLAPEPFSDEFSSEYFRKTLKSSTRSIKELLLDQTKVTGLGNIYAAEAMFLARVNPQIAANKISKIKANRLHKFVKEVLFESIENGSTINVNPENIDGSYYDGGFEDHWHVYDREDEPCSRCGAKIKRIKQSGRSSYFCPRCQER